VRGQLHRARDFAEQVDQAQYGRCASARPGGAQDQASGVLGERVEDGGLADPGRSVEKYAAVGRCALSWRVTVNGR